MGQLIKGDPREERLYSMEEISLASGIKKSTLRARRERLGFEATRRGYPYAQVLEMIRKHEKPYNAPDARRVEELRQLLKRDGYAKEGGKD